MDPKGKGMVVNNKEKESIFNEPRDDKTTDSGSSHKKKDEKKKRRIKKIVYYNSDESSSSQRDDDDEKKKTVNSNFSFDYSRILFNSNAHLLSIPLGKPPHFDGEDYSFWSHKMRSHLFSLHPSIWEIVENGMVFDSTDNPVFINEQIHKNAQATTIFLASLCRDEYHKVSGLDNAKQIWDTLKISHEGNDATMVTKMELVEGELGRFAMIRGEEPTQTYNRLKTLVNKIRSYGSTRWMDHDVVRLMLRSFTVLDPHLVNSIRENPRYTKMTPEEILGKFVSGCMMIKEARYVDEALNGPMPIYEPQKVALKATSSREALPSKVAQVEAARLNEDEMALIIKRFKTALRERKEYSNKNKAKGKRSCFKCGKQGHFIAQCLDNENDQGEESHGKKEKRKAYKKAKGEAHLGKEWDSDCSSSDSDDEGLAASAFNKSSLFPNERHTCLMAKEKKVYASGGSSWIIDSGCTNHMTGEKEMFTSYIKNKDSQDSIIFGDGNQGKVKGLGKIAISSEHSISNVFLVESLGYNLLSISQLCNMGYNCLFTNVDVSVFRRSDGSLAFKGVLDDKLYLVDFSKEEAGLDACLISKTSMGWLWHRRLAHVGMKNLHKLLKGEHVLGLTNVSFEKDRPCAACQAGK
jgi:hypothetical protein